MGSGSYLYKERIWGANETIESRPTVTICPSPGGPPQGLKQQLACLEDGKGEEEEDKVPCWMTNDKQAGFCSNSWVPSKHLCPASALQASALSDDGHKVTSLTSANLVWPSLQLFPFALKPWVWSHGWNKSRKLWVCPHNQNCAVELRIVWSSSERFQNFR